jgi:hypothetical protein
MGWPQPVSTAVWAAPRGGRIPATSVTSAARPRPSARAIDPASVAARNQKKPLIRGSGSRSKPAGRSRKPRCLPPWGDWPRRRVSALFISSGSSSRSWGSPPSSTPWRSARTRCGGGCGTGAASARRSTRRDSLRPAASMRTRPRPWACGRRNIEAARRASPSGSTSGPISARPGRGDGAGDLRHRIWPFGDALKDRLRPGSKAKLSGPDPDCRP